MILDLKALYGKYNMKVTGVIHIGAHFGEEHKTYKELGIQDICYFEPVNKTFNELKKRVGDDAQLFKYALGNENKMMKMFVEDADAYGCSSLLEPSDNYKNIPFTFGEEVEMRRLDDIEYDFSNFNFINLDVQGYELEVLKGGENLLENVDYIMSEVNRITPQKPLEYKDCALVEELIEFLEKYEFKLVEVNWAGVSWGDGFFIKTKVNE